MLAETPSIFDTDVSVRVGRECIHINQSAALNSLSDAEIDGSADSYLGSNISGENTGRSSTSQSMFTGHFLAHSSASSMDLTSHSA